MTLDELKNYLETDSQETKDNILNSIFVRLNQVNPQPNLLPDKIRIMSLHASKGLSAKVVFIPGLVLESARLFYVAITRAKAACIISHTQWRNLYGNLSKMTPSRFCASTGAVFVQQNNAALTAAEIQVIQTSIATL